MVTLKASLMHLQSCPTLPQACELHVSRTLESVYHKSTISPTRNMNASNYLMPTAGNMLSWMIIQGAPLHLQNSFLRLNERDKLFGIIALGKSFSLPNFHLMCSIWQLPWHVVTLHEGNRSCWRVTTVTLSMSTISEWDMKRGCHRSFHISNCVPRNQDTKLHSNVQTKHLWKHEHD
jgi:hypothetical protein